MEILDPEQIKITNSLQQKLYRINKEIEVLNSMELSKEEREKIMERLLQASIRTSLGIEGIIASARQTKEVLEIFNLEGNIKEEMGAQDIINLQRANDFITTQESIKSSFTPNFLRNVHQIVTDGDPNANPGSWRTKPVTHGGPQPCPDHIFVPELIETIHQYFEATTLEDPITLASWLHHQLVKVHPFDDGNGRTSRVIKDWILHKNKLLPGSGSKLDRNGYYDALQKADFGEYEDLITHEASIQQESIDVANQTIKSLRNQKTRRQQVVNFFFKNKSQHNEERYEIWKTNMNQLAAAFEHEANAFTEESDGGLKVSFRKHEIISLQKWLEIQEDGSSRENSFFNLWFSLNKEDFFRTEAYFARHFSRKENTNFKKEYEENSNFIQDSVSLYFGGWDLPEQYNYPAKAYFINTKTPLGKLQFQLPHPDKRISIREFIVGEKNNYCLRYTTEWIKEKLLSKGVAFNEDSKHEQWFAESCTNEDVASEYISDMFRYKGRVK
tara:strand:- start:3309 stop:4808 length:1500 start_codon:yes stop_codon:yes gene_type:complete